MPRTFLPYGRHCLDHYDFEAVLDVLQSDWLTTGPKVEDFEGAMSEYTRTREAVAVSSGTAGLHCAVFALGVSSGDEILIPAITFAATANAVLYQGGIPVFVDVDPDTLLIDVSDLQKKVTPKTKAIVAVDYAGHPCQYDLLKKIALEKGLGLISDACHSLGASYQGIPIGSQADMSVFSFHPVKAITTGEGGMVVTDNSDYAQRLRQFRNHGINLDHKQREARCSYWYEMMALGHNYRLSDIQCALGMTQLKKLDDWIRRRREIATIYDHSFHENTFIKPLEVKPFCSSAHHLYVIRLELSRLHCNRDGIFEQMRAKGIGVNVHYIPVPWHPYYQNLGYAKGNWPVAEEAFEKILSLPIFPGMTREDVEFVIHTITDIVRSQSS